MGEDAFLPRVREEVFCGFERPENIKLMLVISMMMVVMVMVMVMVTRSCRRRSRSCP